MLICSGWAMAVISDRNTAAQDVAKQLGITTTTLLYMYVNGDGTVKEPGQKLFDSFSGQNPRIMFRSRNICFYLFKRYLNNELISVCHENEVEF